MKEEKSSGGLFGGFKKAIFGSKSDKKDPTPVKKKPEVP